MSLPEFLLIGGHQGHHITIHDLINLLAQDTSQQGRGLRVEAVDFSNTVAGASPAQTIDEHVLTVTHSTPGPVSIPLQPTTRAVVVEASAPVDGLSFSNTSALGDAIEVAVLIKASVSISLALDTADLVAAAVPATLAAGTAFPFLALSFDSAPPQASEGAYPGAYPGSYPTS